MTINYIFLSKDHKMYNWVCFHPNIDIKWTIVVPLPFQHKLNYFSFIQNFEKLFLICVEVLIKFTIRVWNPQHSLSRFEPQISKDKVLTLKWSKHTRLFHNIGYIVFIIIYNHYLLKISELKNQVLKLRFKI
jgi:hypothetical protein